MAAAIWWVRRDLRLADNQALAGALAAAQTVIPVFVRDPFFDRSPFVGEKRVAFMLGGLRALDADLRARGSRLIVRSGDPLEVLGALLAETGAGAIWAEEDVSPAARRRDARIGQALPLTLTPGLTVHPPDVVVKDDGEPYTVFTPFSRRWKALPPPRPAAGISAPVRINTPAGIPGELIPDSPALPATVPFPPGEAGALRRLSHFTTGPDAPVYAYGEARNRLDRDGTAQLSPYLRWGMVSARQAASAAFTALDAAPAPDARRSAETWLNELIWREFYVMILHHFPHVRGASFRPGYDAIAWRDDEAGFAAWCAGRTGYPVVDAAQRQLITTGWMHNRARMISASFLVKDLLIDWRRGEQFFMQHLVDGDPAANNGGWQWTAGTGTDAAPYFRIFNPTTQGARHDPEGAYIRRWLPELASVPSAHLHDPAAMPADVQQAAGCRIGIDYPAPLVDHRAARERTLAAYRAAGETRP